MGVFLQDLRYAVRKLAGAPAFTLAAVSTLAIGIGATIAIFSTVNATMLRPLPSRASTRTDRAADRLHRRPPDDRPGGVAEVVRINESNISTTHAVAVTSSPFEPTLLRDNAAPVHVTVLRRH